MEIEFITELAGETVLQIGLPVLIGLFFLEGMIVGKLVQPPVLFVGVVAITGPSLVYVSAIAMLCTVAFVGGQMLIYRSADPRVESAIKMQDKIPYFRRVQRWIITRFGKHRLKIVDTIFNRYGTIGIIIGTFIPGIRAVIAVPAALSSYTQRRFVLAISVGHLLYFVLLGAIAYQLL